MRAGPTSLALPLHDAVSQVDVIVSGNGRIDGNRGVMGAVAIINDVQPCGVSGYHDCKGRLTLSDAATMDSNEAKGNGGVIGMQSQRALVAGQQLVVTVLGSALISNNSGEQD
jgi:hypothetical protein